MKSHASIICAGVLSSAQSASAVVLAGSNNGNDYLHAIAWQTFENAGANNNSGISDSTPDSNSTFDSTPVGTNSNGFYLIGGLGSASASTLGRSGLGLSTDSSFLQGPTVGAGTGSGGLNIVDIPDAGTDGLSGTPGTAQNSQGSSGSSWKFQTNGNQEFGDFSITNTSDFSFRLERVHFDARSANANAPKTLDFIYLNGTSNLRRADNGNEIADLSVVNTIQFPSGESNVSIHNASVSLAARYNTGVRLGPGDSATFRFRWTNQGGNFAQAQIDNLGLSGTFQDQNNGFALIDPAAVAVPEPSSAILVTLGVGIGLGRRKR